MKGYLDHARRPPAVLLFSLLAIGGDAPVVAAEAKPDPAAVFRIVRSTPSDLGLGVSRTGLRPSFSFSLPVDRFSLPANAVTLTAGNGQQVSLGSNEVSGAEIRTSLYYKYEKLLPQANYTLQLSPAIRSTSGEPISGLNMARFATQDAQWRATQVISDNQFLLTRYMSAEVDSDGNAFAVWRTDTDPSNIRVSRYDAASATWGAPQLISGGAGSVADPVIVVEGGSAVLVWQHVNTAIPSYSVVWATRFNGSQWETPRVISHMDGSQNTAPRVAIGALGEIAVVWKRFDFGLGTSLWLSRSNTVSGSSWVVPQRIDNPAGPAGDIGSISVATSRVATSPHRPLVAVAWSARSNALNNIPVIWARVIGATPAGVNPPPQIISYDNGDPSVEPQVVVDGGRTTRVTWRQYGPGPTNNPVFSNVQVTSLDISGWQAPVWVSNLYAGARNVRLTTNAVGNGAQRSWVSWTEPGVNGSVWAAPLLPAAIGPANVIATGSLDAVNEANLVVDDVGNVLAAWSTPFVGQRVMSARFVARNNSWSGPLSLDDAVLPGTASRMNLSINRSGDARAAWVLCECGLPTPGRASLVSRGFD